jgi:hypothetical protein
MLPSSKHKHRYNDEILKPWRTRSPANTELRKHIANDGSCWGVAEWEH